jgi:DNA-binding NarL/FixJ family response regulator
MPANYRENRVGSSANREFGQSRRAAVMTTEGRQTTLRLREALAREAALLRQIDGLVQHQQEVLDRLFARRKAAADRTAALSPRQRQIMELVLAGHPSKNIAADLGISQRTIESHRASIMKKVGAKSLPELARWAVAAAWSDDPDPGPRTEAAHPRASRALRDRNRRIGP